MSRKRASKEEVLLFLEAVYPGNGSLAATTFSERTVLRDATALIKELRIDQETLHEIQEVLKNAGE